MPPLSPDNASGYWRSLDELSNTPEFRKFVTSEFPSAAEGGLSRRRWMQLMGASLALAGVTGCRWEKENIVPLSRRPADRVPGELEYYATVMELDGAAVGLLVTCVDGRPIKVEGNPEHPASLGATGVIHQASILELYDPDRSATLVQRSGGQDVVADKWDTFDAFARKHFAGLRNSSGKGLRILAEPSNSPTLAAVRKRLLEAMPETRWHEYASVPRQPQGTYFDLDKADVILALDCDLLGHGPASLRYAHDFAARRDPDARAMNRLYVVECTPTVTGAAADHRLPLRSGQIETFARAVCAKVALLTKQPLALPDMVVDAGGHARFVEVVAKDLVAKAGKCLVIAGPQHGEVTHRAVATMNELLGNVGKTVIVADVPESDTPSGTLEELVADVKAGKVDTLLILGGNPVYDAPADLGITEALDGIATSIRLGLYDNETSQQCSWHLPQAHWLEAWGDARAYDGSYGVAQPMIAPLYGGRSAIELLATILGEQNADGQKLVIATFEQLFSAGDWRRTLHDGLLADSAFSVPSSTSNSNPSPSAASGGIGASDGAAPLNEEHGETSDKLELVFRPDAKLHDGRFANNGWLQELPDPITKITWDNVALLSPATAEQLGVKTGTLVKLKLGDRRVTLPACTQPGQADGTVVVTLGYGRTEAGQVGGSTSHGVEPVGVNVAGLRTSDAMHFAAGLEVKPTGMPYTLATTQNHHAIDKVGLEAIHGRLGELVREASQAHYREHPEFAKHVVHHPPLESPFKEPPYDEADHHWAMTIDLSKCIGCNACVVACQAENNIPIVGKDQVSRGREMHWLRVDRYFRDDTANPPMAMQPVPCMQCEMAPCEQVCPVNATVHSIEGLNDMVYNRCVGTRYCGNNCPYKVRRFNYFDYNKDLRKPGNESVKLAKNPDVTVRMRGVMEKCTYCVQRIQRGKIDAKNERRPVRDGEIKTACQQACPAQAITFGDLANKKSAVSASQNSDRNYAMLAELNVKPRTTYLARIRNPNPALETHDEQADHHS